MKLGVLFVTESWKLAKQISAEIVLLFFPDCFSGTMEGERIRSDMIVREPSKARS
jgi:hypothetical protein